jgi:hypothetical protein
LGGKRQADSAGVGLAGALAQIRSSAFKLKHVESPGGRGMLSSEAESIAVALRRSLQARKAAMGGAGGGAVASDVDDVEDAQEWGG